MLIKQNKAALVESADDIEFMLGWKPNQKNQNIKQFSINFDQFSAEEQKFIPF